MHRDVKWANCIAFAPGAAPGRARRRVSSSSTGRWPAGAIPPSTSARRSAISHVRARRCGGGRGAAGGCRVLARLRAHAAARRARGGPPARAVVALRRGAARPDGVRAHAGDRDDGFARRAHHAAGRRPAASASGRGSRRDLRGSGRRRARRRRAARAGRVSLVRPARDGGRRGGLARGAHRAATVRGLLRSRRPAPPARGPGGCSRRRGRVRPRAVAGQRRARRVAGRLADRGARRPTTA